MGMRDTHSRCSPVQEEKFRPEVPFHEEDLRPQPIQRKSRKVLVLDEDKDEKYWEKVFLNFRSFQGQSSFLRR